MSRRMHNFDSLLHGEPTNITFEKVVEYHGLSPKRICFNSCHANALREANFNKVKWVLNIPYTESIQKIFEKETNLKLFHIKTTDKYWCPIEEEENYEIVKSFLNKFKNNVFLRDSLDLSMALSEHYINPENRTEVGELEYQAKWNNCNSSTNKIIDLLVDFISNSPLYSNAKYICAVPSSKKNIISLPVKVVNGISNKIEINNISELVSWVNEKTSVKEMSYDEKWKALESFDIKVDINLEDINQNIILVDDLYQSGITIQFVAMKLKEAGFKRVYGLTIVKSLKDTDNV